MVARDLHFRADSDGVVEMDHVVRFHPHAAEARGRSDFPLLSGSVNVDGAAVGVAILRFETFEPEDARDDRVAARRVGFHDFARRKAGVKLHPRRLSVADFFCDFQPPERRGAAAGSVAEAELRSGNRVARDLHAFAVHDHLFISHADFDRVDFIASGARSQQERETQKEKVALLHGQTIAAQGRVKSANESGKLTIS